MDDITDTLVERAAEKIARDKRRLEAQKRPKNRRLTSLLAAFIFTASAAQLWTASETADASRRHQAALSNYDAADQLMGSMIDVKLNIPQPDLSGCDGLFQYVGKTVKCVQRPI